MVGSGRTRGGGGKEGVVGEGAVGEGAVEEKAAVPLHTDTGLFIALVPALDGSGRRRPGGRRRLETVVR